MSDHHRHDGPVPTELNLSYDDGGQHLLDRTEVELLAVEDEYLAKHSASLTKASSKSNMGGGGGTHGGGPGPGPGTASRGALLRGSGSNSAMQTPSPPSRPHRPSDASHSQSHSHDNEERRGSAGNGSASADGSSPAVREVYRTQMDLILSAGRRSGGKRRGGGDGDGTGGSGAAFAGAGRGHFASASRPSHLAGAGAGGAGGATGYGPATASGKERSKRFAEERRMKMDFQRGDSELGHPVAASSPSQHQQQHQQQQPTPGSNGGIPRDISIGATSSVVSAESVSTTGLDGPSAPTLFMQNPDMMATAAEIPSQQQQEVPAASPAVGAAAATAAAVPQALASAPRESSLGSTLTGTSIGTGGGSAAAATAAAAAVAIAGSVGAGGSVASGSMASAATPTASHLALNSNSNSATIMSTKEVEAPTPTTSMATDAATTTKATTGATEVMQAITAEAEVESAVPVEEAATTTGSASETMRSDEALPVVAPASEDSPEDADADADADAGQSSVPELGLDGTYDSGRDLVPDLPFQQNNAASIISPSAAPIDLSTRSAPLLTQTNMLLVGGREISTATRTTTTSRSDVDDQESDQYIYDGSVGGGGGDDEYDNVMASTRTDSGALCKIRRINLLIDQVESARFPFKKKLILANMNLTSTDLPIEELCSHGMCQSMNKLSLAGNRLGQVPVRIVMELAGLRTLDLSQCDLRSLPNEWSLPHLKRLDLSHNRLADFPDEKILKGLPELQHLDLYGNKITDISLPHGCQVLVKLDHLNMGYNNLESLPDELTGLTNLRTLKIMNNVIENIPPIICEMDLRVIDLSSNPLIQPPVETCERGICSMRRYYHCLKLEEKSRQRMLDEIQRKAEAKKQRKDKTKSKMKKKKEQTLAAFGLGKKSVRVDDDASEITSGSLLSSSPSTNTYLTDKLSMSVPGKGELSRSAPSHGILASQPMKLEGPTLRSKTVGSPFAISEELEAQSKSPINDKALSMKILGGRTPSNEAEAERSHLHNSDTGARAFKVEVDSFLSTGSEDMAEVLAEELEKTMPSDTVNDTLKVIFVGMAMTGKTSIIKRLLEGKNAVIPKREERTVGVDIYNWDPKNDNNDDRDHIDTSIKIEDELLDRTNGDIDVKFSLWDFAGQHVYHATHELFFSPRALYILVWDMGITNSETHKQKRHSETSQGAFKLSYDSSDDEDDPLDTNDDSRRADRALERDIDEKVQFWVDCIQSSAPGAAILPVATFDDYFDETVGWGENEATRRCNIMRDRLLKHEEKRVQGLQERLEAYERGHRANSEAALRLRKLLCSFCRPKLIFGSDGSVVRVSGAKYTGFDRLSEKLVNIATGRDLGGWAYPIFRGHVGARIPRMRLEVRDCVREMRDKFKVVEWGFFMKTLRKKGLHNVEDVSDALHFLTNIGELSYFGDVIKDFGASAKAQSSTEDESPSCPDPEQEEYEDEEAYVFPMDRVTSDAIRDDDRSVSLTASMSSSSAQSVASGLSQFIFLNPRWLVAAVACILRHDLNREINETRRLYNKKQLVGFDSNTLNGDNFTYAHLNCPVVTAEDACMLWQAKKIINKAAERALQYSNNMAMSPFDFLQRLLIRFRVFVPIDLDIEKAMLGGKEFGRSGEPIEVDERTSLELNQMTENDARFFFLPSLLGPGEPGEVWSYKNSDSWKTTVCHSILFPDGVPPGLMERITATVLSDIYSATQSSKQDQNVCRGEEDKVSCDAVRTSNTVVSREKSQPQLSPPAFDVGQLFVKEILCWRSSFYLKLGMQVTDQDDGEVKESVVEMFCALLEKDSHLCVSSDFMGVGMRRLVLSGKGQIGEGGRKIWRGGYTLVIRAIGRVMEEYGGLEFEKQGICPECLAKRPISRASLWDWSLIRAAAHNGDDFMRCQIGHRVDTRIITGTSSQPQTQLTLQQERSDKRLAGTDHVVPVTDLLRGVVVVGLWDGKADKIVRVGSGFVADKKRGLIVTASHTLMNIWGDERSPFGENYYGLRSAKVVVGVIPRERSGDSIDSTTAVFRYFATIVAKDENIDSNGVCHMDACVLRITTRLEQDVVGDGDGCAQQPEILLANTPDVWKKERLHHLKVSNREAELEEQVRILGYNQGGEGLMRKGMSVNRVADFARGYVCMKFNTDVEEGWAKSRRFKPKEEIVVICPTIGGHSGGPCVNQSGEVIGILSRADPSDRQRCYLVPAKAWRGLLKQAKHMHSIFE